MLLATVVGNVWATVKDPTLEGLRFLVVQPYTLEGERAQTLLRRIQGLSRTLDTEMTIEGDIGVIRPGPLRITRVGR